MKKFEYKPWTAEEEQFLIDNIETMSNREIGIKLGRNASKVMNKLNSLGLKRTKENLYTGDLEGEIWLDYQGKYLVSNKARVFSLYSESIMKFSVNNKGYPYMTFSGTSKLVHIIVAELHVDKPESKVKLEVNHKNGNKLDFSADNLEWVTHRRNLKHAVETGLHKNFTYGQNNPLNKFSDEKVKAICIDIASGKLSNLDIAEKHGVTRDYVYRISIKKRSAHISDNYF